MTEYDPEFEAEYQAELKRIKLHKAREKARRDAEDEDLDAEYKNFGYQAEKGRLLMQGDFKRKADEQATNAGCSLMLWGLAMIVGGLGFCWLTFESESIISWASDSAHGWKILLVVHLPLLIAFIGLWTVIAGLNELPSGTVDVDID